MKTETKLLKSRSDELKSNLEIALSNYKGVINKRRLLGKDFTIVIMPKD